MYQFALISAILLMVTFATVALYAEEGSAEQKYLLPADVTQMDLDYILDELDKLSNFEITSETGKMPVVQLHVTTDFSPSLNDFFGKIVNELNTPTGFNVADEKAREALKKTVTLHVKDAEFLEIISILQEQTDVPILVTPRLKEAVEEYREFAEKFNFPYRATLNLENVSLETCFWILIYVFSNDRAGYPDTLMMTRKIVNGKFVFAYFDEQWGYKDMGEDVNEDKNEDENEESPRLLRELIVRAYPMPTDIVEAEKKAHEEGIYDLERTDFCPSSVLLGIISYLDDCPDFTLRTPSRLVLATDAENHEQIAKLLKIWNGEYQETENERKFRENLKKKVTLKYADTPTSAVLKDMQEKFGFPVFDVHNCHTAEEKPITFSCENVTVAEVLRQFSEEGSVVCYLPEAVIFNLCTISTPEFPRIPLDIRVISIPEGVDGDYFIVRILNQFPDEWDGMAKNLDFVPLVSRLVIQNTPDVLNQVEDFIHETFKNGTPKELRYIRDPKKPTRIRASHHGIGEF